MVMVIVVVVGICVVMRKQARGVVQTIASDFRSNSSWAGWPSQLSSCGENQRKKKKQKRREKGKLYKTYSSVVRDLPLRNHLDAFCPREIRIGRLEYFPWASFSAPRLLQIFWVQNTDMLEKWA
jgi:hypothetical protein